MRSPCWLSYLSAPRAQQPVSITGFVRFAPNRRSSAVPNEEADHMSARDELVSAIGRRYAHGGRAEDGRIPDECAAVTGFIASIRCAVAGEPRFGPRPARWVHDDSLCAST
jgi:hypothetical protein